MDIVLAVAAVMMGGLGSILAGLAMIRQRLRARLPGRRQPVHGPVRKWGTRPAATPVDNPHDAPSRELL